MKSTNYDGRQNMETVMDSIMDGLFSHNIHLGKIESNLHNHETLKKNMRLSNINSDAAFMAKFLPDYILSHDENALTYFVDFKFSRAPLFGFNRMKLINKLEKSNKRYTSMNIGVIAREAFYSYKKYYPKLIVIVASPYNPKVLMAQFIEDIKVLHINGANYTDSDAPNYVTDNAQHDQFEIMTDYYFELDYNPYSTGSGTQHANIDLDSFKTFETFFRDLDFTYDDAKLKEIKKNILDLDIDYSGSYNPDNSKEFFESRGFPWKI